MACSNEGNWCRYIVKYFTNIGNERFSFQTIAFESINAQQLCANLFLRNSHVYFACAIESLLFLYSRNRYKDFKHRNNSC